MDITYHPENKGATTHLETINFPGTDTEVASGQFTLAIVTFGSRTIVGFVREDGGALHVHKACDLAVQPLVDRETGAISGTQVRVFPYLINGTASLRISDGYSVALIETFDPKFRELVIRGFRQIVDPPKIEIPSPGGLILP